MEAEGVLEAMEAASAGAGAEDLEIGEAFEAATGVASEEGVIEEDFEVETVVVEGVVGVNRAGESMQLWIYALSELRP